MNETVTEEQISQFVEDASYLQDEAEALKYVIDQVPYQENHPQDGISIADRLLFIDHAQLSYFRTYLEEAVENPRPTRIESFKRFKEDFESPDKEIEDIQNLLDDIIKHRAAVINRIKKVPLVDWATNVYYNDEEITLFDFIQQMVNFDRRQLKKITNLARILSGQKQTDRVIKQKRAMQEPPVNKTE